METKQLLISIQKLLNQAIKMIDLFLDTPGASDQAGNNGGRPTNKLYDWAYEEIQEGREQSEVYIEWLELLGSDVHDLADPLDSFKKAMKYREDREKKGNISVLSVSKVGQ